MVKRAALHIVSNNRLFSARRGGVDFPNERKVDGKVRPSRGANAPLKGMIPPTSASFGGRRGDGRFSRAMVTFAETRLLSCTGKGGGSIGC